MSIKPFVCFAFVVLVFSLTAAADNGTVNASANASVNASLNASANLTAKAAPLSPLQRALNLYTFPSETKDVVNVTAADGGIYALVKVNGTESLLLDPSFAVVTDAARIQSVAGVYAKTIPLAFTPASMTALSTEFGTLNASFYNMTRFYWEFETSVRVCYEDVLRKWLCSTVYDADFHALLNLSLDFTHLRHDINNGTNQMNESLRNLGLGIADLQASFTSADASALAAKLNAMQGPANNFTAGYNLFSAAHNHLITYRPFATDGGLNRVSIATGSLSNVISVLNLANALPNASVMTANILAFTNGRASTATIRASAEPVAGNFSSFDSRYAAFAKAYANLTGKQPAGMKATYDRLSALSLAVSGAANASAAQSASAAFFAQFSAGDAQLQSATLALPQLAGALSSQMDAQKSIGIASTRLGPNDGRVSDMQKQYTSLSTALSLKSADFAQGKNATASDFSNLSSQMAVLAATARQATPPENQVDLVLVVGALVLLAALGGVVFFLRKYRVQLKSGQKEARSEELEKK